MFEIEQADDQESEKLVCKACKKWAKGPATKLGFDLVGGSTYSIWASGVKKPMEKWFSNMKQKLAQHLMTDAHHNALKTEMCHAAEILRKKDEIFKTMRHLAYLAIKSNLPLDQFPTLLATVNACGLELGNINHSRAFITQFLELVNVELIKKTAAWFDEQIEITFTLDIGTVYGMTLLAVLFMSNGKVKLADLAPITSKKREDVANVCFESCKLHEKVMHILNISRTLQFP